MYAAAKERGKKGNTRKALQVTSWTNLKDTAREESQ